jgi:hypothetical protein
VADVSRATERSSGVTGEVGIGGFSMRDAQGSDDRSDVHV